jgi:hypothetical protein
MKKEVLKELTAKPGKEHHVSDFNPSFTADMSKQDAKEQLAQNIEKLSELQSMLYAQFWLFFRRWTLPEKTERSST